VEVKWYSPVESEHRKTYKRGVDHPGGQTDKSTHHRHKAADKNRQGTPASEPAFGYFQVLRFFQNVAAVFENERLSTPPTTPDQTSCSHPG